MSDSCDPMDCQTPLSRGFSRQEYWNWLPFPAPGEPSQPRNRTWVSCFAGRFFTNWATREAQGPGLPQSKDFTSPYILNKVEHISLTHLKVCICICMLMWVRWMDWELHLIPCVTKQGKWKIIYKPSENSGNKGG